jgi:HAD superfamily hydrolase (TIGR01549 family)
LIEAVIFDLDGTLVQLPIDYERLFLEFGRIMKTDNVRPLTKTIPQLDDKTRENVFEAWEKAEREALANLTVKDEGMTIYKKFSDIPKALVTMQGKTLAQSVIENLRLSFNFVISRENSLNRLEQLEGALKKLGVSPQNVLLVGDTEEDYRAAKEAGCQFKRV